MNGSLTTWNIEDFHLDDDFFSGLYASSPFKLTAVTFSVTFSLVLLPFLFGMIWKERYGLDIKRVITNRLISSLAWSCIAYITVVQSLEILRHVYGPFPELFCFYYFVIKNALSQLVALLIILIFVFRYIFIFCLKNPMAFQDHFWAFFINIWLAWFCLGSQWLVLYLPGHQPISYYFCTGKNPSDKSFSFAPKRNALLRLINIISMLLLIIMYIRIEIFKWKESKLTTWLENQKSLYLKAIEDKFLASYLMYMLIILNTAIGSVLIIKINSLQPFEANFYPNYVYVIIWQLISPLQIIAGGVLAYYLENRKIIAILFSEVKDTICSQKYRYTT